MSTLMFSISGVRGIIGDGLEPETIVKYTSAYADFIGTGKVVLGRDSRISGEMVKSLIVGTLLAKGIDVVDIGICPTPTVQFNVKILNAQGGIAVSASHNPNEWNALKLLNSTGQFLSPEEFSVLKNILETGLKPYASWDKLGKYTLYEAGLKNHKDKVLSLPFLEIEKIKEKKYKVVADCVNGAGYKIIPELLRDFGCEVIELNCESTGIFPRLPEPLPENLTETMKAVVDNKADFAVVVDPDVDRLVLITDKGEPFSEENTITQAVKFILSKQKGNAVVNLSTTRGTDDVANAAGGKLFRSPVGEANVVKKMKETGAVIGGEGSGGVILPALHYGRDALVGIAILLQHLTEFGGKLSELKEALPVYFIAKRKIELKNISPDLILNKISEFYKDGIINKEDGIRIDFPDHWVHFRKSNTEPIIRIITESPDQQHSEQLIDGYMTKIKEFAAAQNIK